MEENRQAASQRWKEYLFIHLPWKFHSIDLKHQYAGGRVGHTELAGMRSEALNVALVCQ